MPPAPDLIRRILAARVLAGIQVPDVALTAFHDALERLAYPYTVEHEHPAVSLFLR